MVASEFYDDENLNVWGFDFGKGSLGEAVRRGLDFSHVESMILDPDFAETKTAAGRRRQMRTRKAHKMREEWLEKCLSEAGIEILQRRKVEFVNGKWTLCQKGDKRLEREFPVDGDKVCYNSIALRCKLLLGEKLESWQIFKALNSAIQNRGYDENIPWKDGEISKAKKDEDSDYAQKLAAYENEKSEILAQLDNWEDYNYPCFFKAFKIGLWSPENPTEVKLRIDNNAQKAKKYVVPRKDVESEFVRLVEMASLQYPKLRDKAAFILYGISETAYASYNPDLRKKFSLKRGAETDWSALGQKIPRFNNRIIDKCRMIPRLNVCKIRELKKIRNESDLLYYEVVCAMKLLNLRFFRKTAIASLSFEEFKSAFKIAKNNGYKLKKKTLEKFLESIGGSVLDENNAEVEAPKESGRASFSRPAMTILKELIFSGKSPALFYCEKILSIANTDPNKGIVAADLDFLKLMGDCDWSGIFVPDVETYKYLNSINGNPSIQINKLIGSQNDPIVRHRLTFFYERVKFLEKKFGRPDKIILEFVRDDFLGKKKKLKYQKEIKARFAEKLKIASELDELSDKASGEEKNKYKASKMLLKMELLRKQNFQCVYTGEALCATDLPSLEIEHIVPQSRGGSDSIFNYVITTEKNNKLKGNRTPYEWLSSDAKKWEAYTRRVGSLSATLGKRRCELLLSDHAEELVEKYTALAETAWIAKIAQRILCMHFGFQFGAAEGEKRVFTVSGSVTASIRGAYGLNKILHEIDIDKSVLSAIDIVKKYADAEKKNRENKKHHALDAMCLCFAPTGIKGKRAKTSDILPREIANDAENYFRKYLDKIMPHEVAIKKASLEDGIYSTRIINRKKTIVRKFDLYGLAFKGLKPVYKLQTLNKNAKSIINPVVRKIVQDFAATKPNESEWEEWCKHVSIPSKNGSGTRILRVLTSCGNPEEYKDISKDECGAYHKGDSHKGQIIWESKDGKYRVAPIYVHASRFGVINALKEHRDFKCIAGEFRKHCLVKLERDAVNKGGVTLAKAGLYMLNTIMTAGKAVLTDPNGIKTKSIGINYLMKAGMKRIE